MLPDLSPIISVVASKNQTNFVSDESTAQLGLAGDVIQTWRGQKWSTFEGVLPKSIIPRKVSIFIIQNALRENQSASYAILKRRIFRILKMRVWATRPRELILFFADYLHVMRAVRFPAVEP